MSKHDPQKNLRKGALYGIIIGFFLSAFGNGWLVVTVDPEGGEGLAQVYLWLFSGSAGVIFLITVLKIKNVNPLWKGLFGGIAGISIIINSVAPVVFQAIINVIQNFG